MKILMLLLLSVTLASAKTNSLSGIKWRSYDGANQKGQCAPYATSLAFDLHRKGIESWYVEYDWKNAYEHGIHAIVVLHADDMWYVVDNESPSPKWVKHYDDFEKMVKQRFSYVKKVRTVATIGGTPGDLKDLLTGAK